MKNKLKKFFLNKDVVKAYPILIPTFVALIVCSIIFKQSFIKTLPCAVSLFVYLIDAQVNRYAKALGAVNCFIYCIGYLQLGLYGSVASALLISMPLQVATFIMWGKNKYKDSQSTIIKHSSADFKIIYFLATVAVSYIAVEVFVNLKGGRFPITQGILFGLSLLYTFLIMFGYIDGRYLMIIGEIVNLVIYIILVLEDISQITYLILQVYTITMSSIGLVNWIKLDKKQKIDAELVKQN